MEPNLTEGTESPVTQPSRKPRKFLWLALAGLLLVALIVVGSFFFAASNHANKIVTEVEQKDALLVTRTTNALAITSSLSFANVIAETNSVIAARTALINEIEQQKSKFFQQKFATEKEALIVENSALAQAQLISLKQEVIPLVQQDNIALGNMFIMEDENSTLSWQEVFDGTDKNVTERATLVNKLELMPQLKFSNTFSGYVGLLNAENDFCRTYGRYERALFAYSNALDFYLADAYADYNDVITAKNNCMAMLKDFNAKYTALLKVDKAFWPTAAQLLPTRDLQKALQDFFGKVNITLNGSKT